MELLANETNINTRRNAIVLLFKVEPVKALKFLVEQLEEESADDFDDIT